MGHIFTKPILEPILIPIPIPVESPRYKSYAINRTKITQDTSRYNPKYKIKSRLVVSFP